MSIIYPSSQTATTVNRAIDNNMGTTTQSQGATADGLIISENLQPVVQCTNGMDYHITDKTITGTPPLSFHAIAQHLFDWSIDGNTDSGNSVGDKTINILDINTFQKGRLDNGQVTYPENTTSLTISNNIVMFTTDYQYRGICSDFIEISENELSIVYDYIRTALVGVKFVFYNENKTWLNTDSVPAIGSIPPAITEIPANAKYVRIAITGQSDGGGNYQLSNNAIYYGETALPFVPYGYDIPIVVNNTDTYHCYITDVLRKSDGENPVYDTMSSDGTITRRVDTDGTPLETPTTETYTAPDITVNWGWNTVDVDTAVTPSNMIINYKDD